MTNVELAKLWRSVFKSKGTWVDVLSGYRKATGSEQKDVNLKSTISNRLSAIRKELLSRGISEEKVAEALPKFRRTSVNDMDEVCELLIKSGQMEAAE